MIEIDLQLYKDKLTTISKDGSTYIFDPIRAKHIKMLPEELVRQLLLQYLLLDRKLSKKLINVEKVLKINGQIKRFDIVIYDNNAAPKILIECKRPQEKINQNVFNQISTYNLALHADYMIITNGIETHCCKMDYEQKTYHFIDHIPNKTELESLIKK